MQDLTLLRAEMDRCRTRLVELNAEIDFVLDDGPINTTSLEAFVSRLKDSVERLEAVAVAIMSAHSQQTWQ